MSDLPKPSEFTGRIVAIDTETTGINVYSGQDTPFGVSWAIDGGSSGFADKRTCGVDPVSWITECVAEANLVIMHNAAFDICALDQTIGSYFCDTKRTLCSLLAARVLDPGLQSYALNSLCVGYFNVAKLDMKNKGNMIDQPPDEVAAYAIQDAELTLRLGLLLMNKYKAAAQQDKDTLALELKLLPVLCDMQRRGIAIDTRMLGRAVVLLDDDAKEALAALPSRDDGNAIRPNAVADIVACLTDAEVRSLPKTPTGKPQTTKDVIERSDIPLLRIVADARQALKAAQYPTQITGAMSDGRCYANINQSPAITGRMSYSKPNLQQVYGRNPDIATMLKRCFVADAGMNWWHVDMSQFELRIWAAVAKETILLDAWDNDIEHDPYLTIQALVKEQGVEISRFQAKTMTLASAYGQGQGTTCKALDLPTESVTRSGHTYLKPYGNAAEQLFKAFHSAMPNIRKALDNNKEVAEAQGFVRSLYGRKIACKTQAAARRGICHVCQSTAADIHKTNLVSLSTFLADHGGHLALTVHDDYHIFLPKSSSDTLLAQMSAILVNHPIGVPLLAKFDPVGSNWAEAVG